MDKRIIGGIAVAALVLLAAVVWAFTRSGEEPEPSGPSSILTTTSTTGAATSVTTTSQTTKPLYILGAWEGKLAVFAPPDSSPYQVFDVYLSSLPTEEQQRLNRGIVIYDEPTLASLLEDYTS